MERVMLCADWDAWLTMKVEKDTEIEDSCLKTSML